MSFTIVQQCPPRLHRSELAVPGSSPQFFEKAARSAADVVFLDLEDAVAPDQKVQARRNIIQALHEIDWGDKTLTVRINGLDTSYMYRDVIDVIEQGSERLDMLMIPKVGTAADVYALDMRPARATRRCISGWPTTRLRPARAPPTSAGQIPAMWC